MALDNLEQRLRARYGDAAIFTVVREPEQFIVRFTIPLANGLPSSKEGTHENPYR